MVLIAATGERANPAPLAIDTAAKPGVWSKGGNTVKGAPLPVQSDKTAVLPDGSTGRVREITFPKASGQEHPLYNKSIPSKQIRNEITNTHLRSFGVSVH